MEHFVKNVDIKQDCVFCCRREQWREEWDERWFVRRVLVKYI